MPEELTEGAKQLYEAFKVKQADYDDQSAKVLASGIDELICKITSKYGTYIEHIVLGKKDEIEMVKALRVYENLEEDKVRWEYIDSNLNGEINATESLYNYILSEDKPNIILMQDLGFNSMDFIEMLSGTQKKYGISLSEDDFIITKELTPLGLMEVAAKYLEAEVYKE